jgi:hypothetical protein
MANWVDQHLHVVGSKTDIDRFIGAGFRRKNREQFDNVLDLHALCPLKRTEAKEVYTHDSAVVLMHYQTRTQAFFGLTTSWDYPAEFYARLAQHWPTLAFACSINEDMGSFGGVIVATDGALTNLVEHYGVEGYSRQRHARQIRRALDRWRGLLSEGRDWRIVAMTPWEHRSMPFDAHFDDDFWFYFRTREEMAAFRARYGGRMPLRRVRGEWKRTRLGAKSGD